MKIGTVSQQTGLGIHTIRYYEKQGLIRNPLKDESGHRDYSNDDVDILNWIACMKNSGMSLNRIKQYTEAFYAKDKVQCIDMLQEHLQHLSTQQDNIAHYIAVTKSKIQRFKTS